MRLGIGTFVYHVLLLVVWRIALVGIAGLSGCGRYGFCAGNVAGADGAAPDTPGGRPNLVFVTSNTTTGVLAAPAVQTADKLCNDAATAAGLPGTFVAWISTSQVNAIDRLAGSRGWVRTDRVPVVDLPADLVAGKMLNPISVDEHGVAVDPQTDVWTGTGGDGRLAATCNDWSSSGGNSQFGAAGNGYPFYTSLGTNLCSTPGSLFCFEVGNIATVSPQATAGGRIAFLGHARMGTDTSLTLMDGICQVDAGNNGLAGSFAAAVATSSSTIASRFAMDSRPWVRIDGTVIAATGPQLFDGTTLRSFVNQTADGSYDTSYGDIFTGAVTPFSVADNACSDWTSISAGSIADVGRAKYTTGPKFWQTGMDTCDMPDHVLCLQQ